MKKNEFDRLKKQAKVYLGLNLTTTQELFNTTKMYTWLHSHLTVSYDATEDVT